MLLDLRGHEHWMCLASTCRRGWNSAVCGWTVGAWSMPSTTQRVGCGCWASIVVRRTTRTTWRARTQKGQKLPRRHDTHALELTDIQQVFVFGDDQVCLPTQGSLQKLGISPVSGFNSELAAWRSPPGLRTYVVQQLLDYPGRQFELGPVQHSLNLGQDLRAQDQIKCSGSPAADDFFAVPPKRPDTRTFVSTATRGFMAGRASPSLSQFLCPAR